MKTKIVKGDIQNVGLDFAKKIIEISQTMVSSLDLDEIIKTLVKQSIEMILSEKVIVWLYRKKTNTLYPHFYTGIEKNKIEGVEYSTDEGVVGWVFSNKKALIEPRLQKSTIFVKKGEFADDVHNVACVPITFKDQTLGVLYAANKQQKFDFTPEDVNHLTLLANYSAIAIYNSNLYHKLDVEAKRVKGLYEISSAPLQQVELGDVIDKMLLVLSGVFDFRGFTVFLFDSNSLLFNFTSSLGYNKEFQDEVLYLEDDFVENAVEGNRVVICNNLEQKCLKKLQDDDGAIKSLAIVPLYADKTLIGIVTMGSEEELSELDQDNKNFIKAIAGQIATVIQNNQYYSKAQNQIMEFKLLRRIFKTLQMTLTLEEVLNRVCEFVTEELNVDTCSILLYDDKLDMLLLKATKGYPQDWIERQTLKIGDGLTGWVAKYKEELVVKDAQKDPRFIHQIGEFIDKHQSFLGHPILYKTRLIGVLVGETLQAYDFSANDIHTFAIIADEISLFIEKAKLFNELKDMYTKVIRIFSDIIEIQNPEISGHCDRVARYVDILCNAAEVDDPTAEQLRIAAYLHDIDKLGLSITDLKKSSKGDFEKNYMDRREMILNRLIDPFNLPDHVKSSIKLHHENFDGTGSPEGLSGEDIPIGARILAVANGFDKFSFPIDKNKKPSLDKGLKHLRENAGTKFDPDLVDKFINSKPDIEQVFQIEVLVREKDNGE